MILLYILVMTFLFALLDWETVHLTRWVHREWMDWMHQHEKAYALITGPLEFVLCSPCVALKPVFYDALMRVGASQEEQEALTHAPPASLAGFYHLPERGYSWTFVPWSAWFLYWLVPSAVWLMVVT